MKHFIGTMFILLTLVGHGAKFVGKKTYSGVKAVGKPVVWILK